MFLRLSNGILTLAGVPVGISDLLLLAQLLERQRTIYKYLSRYLIQDKGGGITD